MFRTPLLSFASVMLFLVFSLSSLVTRQSSDSAANGASGTVRNTGAEIAQLTTSLLLLPLEILLTALLLKRLWETSVSTCSTLFGIMVACLRPNQSSNSFFGSAECLVPGAGSTIGVVLAGARRRESSTRHLHGGVGGIVLGLGLVLLGITLGLIASAAGQGPKGALDGASDGVDSSLEGRGVIVGRHCEDMVFLVVIDLEWYDLLCVWTWAYVQILLGSWK